MTIRVSAEEIDPGAELNRFEAAQGAQAGAIVSFTGRVRADDGLTALTLEHYPAMAQRELERITAEATARWSLLDTRVLHRVGPMAVGAVIVFVATAAPHRAAAFEAAAFLMDYLKTRAPIWKKETGAKGARWVEAHARDDQAAARWKDQSQT